MSVAHSPSAMLPLECLRGTGHPAAERGAPDEREGNPSPEGSQGIDRDKQRKGLLERIRHGTLTEPRTPP